MISQLVCVVSTWSLIHIVGAATTAFTETRPVLRLKSTKLFATNRTVEDYKGTHLSLPRVFDELTFECTSTLPTKWNYYNQQVKLYAVKKIEINKWRLYGRANRTIHTFYSTLTAQLNNLDRMIDLSCENICPENLNGCEYLNTHLKIIDSDQDSAYFHLQFVNGSKALRKAAQAGRKVFAEDDRIGYNPGCNYTLHMDLHSGAYACTLEGSQEEVRSIFVPCRNPDECDTVFKSGGENCSTNTFLPNCTSDFCSEIRNATTLFVLGCGKNNQYSVARGFYKTLDDVKNGRKELHEYKRKRVPFEKMVEISMTMNADWEKRSGSKYVVDKNVTYTRYDQEFVCMALKSFFSYGFRWILGYENGTESDLGPGAESSNDSSQLYISRKNVVFNSTSVVKITCEAPNWNTFHGTNSTINLTVEDSIAPCFNENDDNPKSCLQIKEISIPAIQTQTLRCRRNGHPPALITWSFDGHESKEVQETQEFSEVLLNPGYPYSEVTCVASNAAGEAKIRFKFHRDATNSDVVATVTVVVCALIIILVVILIAVYKVRKTKEGAYLSGGDIEEFFHGTENGGHDALALPYDVKLEISRDSFTLDNVVLGSGAYGKVVKGHIGFLAVAIKITKSSSESLPYVKALLTEVKIMSYVGSHPNVVNLIGACTSNIQKNDVQIVLEFCEQGDLLSVIKKGRSKFVDLFDASPSLGNNYLDRSIASQLVTSDMILSTRHLIRWGMDIADGMEFISSKNIIHGDLAARNVLVTHDLKAKISDFGLSKRTYCNSVYVKKSHAPLPIRWMAYESMKSLEFSTQSDVWSFGVTLWELFSLGGIPYEKHLWEFESHRLLEEGLRLQKPSYASQAIYELMLQTWKLESLERPSFSDLKISLNEILDDIHH